MRVELTRRVRYSDIDTTFHISLGALLRLFQDVSAMHSEQTGYGIRALSKQGVAWIISKLAIVVDRYPEYGEELCMTSWSRGTSGFQMLRDFELSANGQRIGGGSSVWFYFDRQAGKIARVPNVIDYGYGVDKRLALAAGIEHWTPYERFEPESKRTYRPTSFDLDAGGHVNNARYVDYVLDAARDVIGGAMIQSTRISFSREINTASTFDVGFRRDGDRVLFKLVGETDLFARGEIHLVRS